MQWSRILEEWSNLIGCKMSSSPIGVYTTAKTCPVENFKHRWKNDIVTNIATFVLLGGVFQKSSFLGNLKPSDKKLDPRKTPTWGIFCLY